MTIMRVLLVDDEHELVSTLKERMEMRDIHAETALNGDEAIKKINEMDFDVVLLDIHMPGTHGIDLMKQIKELKPDVEVILLTGRGSESDREKGMKLGAFDYLVKPINISNLLEKLRNAVVKKRD